MLHWNERIMAHLGGWSGGIIFLNISIKDMVLAGIVKVLLFVITVAASTIISLVVTRWWEASGQSFVRIKMAQFSLILSYIKTKIKGGRK